MQARTSHDSQSVTAISEFVVVKLSPQSFSQETDNSPDLDGNSPDLEKSSPDLERILHSKLAEWGYQKMPGKMSKERMEALIVILCQNMWLTLNELSRLLNRDSKALQDQYLTEMVATERLQLKYPTIKNHPQQAYGSGNV
jgi:hypothetical protein